MTQAEFYRSMPWRRARKAYIKKRIIIDGGMCEVCGDRLGLIVHHIEWLDDIKCNNPEISLNENNLRYECQDCHNKERNPLGATAKNGGKRVVYLPDGSVRVRGEY